MIEVYGDNLLVEIKPQAFATAESEESPMNPLAGHGKVIAIPKAENILYFGSFNWAFDDSVLNEAMAKKLLDKMKALMGKTIYWEGRADHGMTVDDGKTKLVMIKLSKIIGVSDDV